jgi:8-oxo-dGTP pyrophosphatase MutT (NUDIX family)
MTQDHSAALYCGTHAPLKDAATVVLLRDSAQGLQVLMGKRSHKTRFSAGAFVFPGGGVDATDREALSLCEGVCTQESEQRFGEPDALRYYLAAARELFEEAGIWLFSEQRPDHWKQLQSDLHHGRCELASVLAQLPHRFDCSVLHYYRFWTTPPGMPRRYRTRFFAARAPHSQEVCVDGLEITEHCWIRPQDMLERFAAGEVQLIFPTIKELGVLKAFEDVDAALLALAQLHGVAEIRTRHRIKNGKLIQTLMPGEPGYENLPGW